MERHNPRVPVLNPDSKPAMPTTASRARRWLRDGKAKVVKNKLGIFAIQLLQEPDSFDKQDIIIGIDTGKLFSGIAVQSRATTHFTAHLELPFQSVRKRMEQRRTRRSRKCRTRPARLDNRKAKKVPPSIKANRQLELRIVGELVKILPITNIYFEVVKASGNAGFSPVMGGQYWMIQQLQHIAAVTQKYGYETSIMRRELGLKKEKIDKSKPILETHAVDGIALACHHFKKYERFIEPNAEGFIWNGEVKVAKCQFSVIKRPPISRRQLHLMNPSIGGVRRAYGGSTTPFKFRKGDFVKAQQGTRSYTGYVSGAVAKEKKVSVSDFNWKRLGQVSLNKTTLLGRHHGFITN